MTMQPCESSQHVRYETPWGIAVTVNKEILGRFKRACDNAQAKSRRRRRNGKKGWEPKRIDSYVCREIRDSSSWSRHAYAAAFDFFNKPFPERVDVWGPTNAPPWWFRRCFTKLGFTAGASWISRKDYPHIEWSSNTATPPPLLKRFILKATRGEHTRKEKKRTLKAAIRWLKRKLRNGWRVIGRKRRR